MSEVRASYLAEINPSSPVTIPYGFSTVRIWAIGAGGSGKQSSTPGGGGSGGIAYKVYNIRDTEWGTTLTAVVGTGAYNADGGDSTVDGTLDGAAITQLLGGGGQRAGVNGISSGGDGGDATGGFINQTGNPGQEYDSPSSTPGVGGVIPDGTPFQIAGPGLFGAGGNGDFTLQQGGFNGAVIFEWGYED